MLPFSIWNSGMEGIEIQYGWWEGDYQKWKVAPTSGS